MCRSLRQCIAVFCLLLSGCTLTDSAGTPLATPDLPHVEILFPENGQQVVEGFDLTLDVFAEDQTSGIARIDVFVDGEVLQSASVEGDSPVRAQFRIETNWIASSIGRHPISAIAYRLDNTSSDEVTIVIEVVASGDEAETDDSGS